MRVCAVGLLLLCFFISESQSTFPPGKKTNCSWDHIILKENYEPQAGDTGIVFVSTRHYFPGKKEFLDYNLDTTRFHYFTLFFNHNNWICVPANNFKEAFQLARAKEDVVIYAEGLGKTFISALDRATRLTRSYGVTAVMFDWPTHNPLFHGAKNYKATKTLSKTASKYFARFLDTLDAAKTNSRKDFGHLTLFMHSMGNLLMMHAIQQNYIKVQNPLFDNIVLNAACVPGKNHKEWVEKINIQDRLYITKNNGDQSLKGAKFASFFQYQLGSGARKPVATNAIYIDFSPVLKMEHNYFLFDSLTIERAQIVELYKGIFHGEIFTFNDYSRYRILSKNAVEMVKTDVQESAVSSKKSGL